MTTSTAPSATLPSGSCSGSSPDTLEQKYLCDPDIHRGLREIKNTKYGFQLPVPDGWWVEAQGGVSPAASAYLWMWAGNLVGQTNSVTVLVCPATTGTCPQQPAISPLATQKSSAISGVAGILLQQPNMQCAAKTVPQTASTLAPCGLEYHQVATKGRYTYEVIGQPLVGAKAPAPQFTEVLQGWVWLDPVA